MTQKKPKNIYQRGADDGMILGLYFVVMFALAVISLQWTWANLPLAVLILGVPVFIYRCMLRTHLEAHGISIMSALWMQGIIMFCCGSLILGFAAYVFLEWIDPEFLQRILNTAAEFYDNMSGETAQQISQELHLIIESGVKPSPIDVVFSWMWMGLSSGSLLSLIVAMIVKHIKPKKS